MIVGRRWHIAKIHTARILTFLNYHVFADCSLLPLPMFIIESEFHTIVHHSELTF